jgi:putative cell wall-binding protein
VADVPTHTAVGASAVRACAVVRRVALVAALLAAVLLAPTASAPAAAAAAVAVDHMPVPPAAVGQPFADAGWTVAEPMSAEPFAMVGLDLAAGDGDAAVQIRTALGDGPWSAWLDVPHLHDEGPDPGSAEAVTARPGHRTHPILTGPADRLQVRSAAGEVTATAAWLIDPFGLREGWVQRSAAALRAAWRGTPAPAMASAVQPAVVSRAAWGADESIVGPIATARSVERAFVHHTVGSNDYSPAQAPGVVRGIQAYHVNGNGWSDIGYNLLIDRFGTVYEGRTGGIDQAVIGAQAGGFNTQSTGVALMGTFTSASPGSAALDAVAQVVAWKADIHHFAPLGQGVAVSAGSSRYPEGVAVTLPNVSGHRDVSLTSCPGEATYGRLAAIRADVRARAGDLVVDHATDVVRTRVIRGDPDAAAITFGATLDPPGAWSLEVRDPAGRVVHTAAGEGPSAGSTLHLLGDGWPLGRYTWTIASPGRTSASEWVDLVPPTIEGFIASTSLARARADGALHEPVAVHADLWPQASWRLQVTDPAGVLVHEATGQGDAADAGWLAGVTDPGTYRLTLTAEDAAPATLDLPVRYDLLDRVGAADDPIGGAVLLSGATFASGSADRAVLARHDVFADALAGGPLAGTSGPLLLTTPDALDGRVVAELDRVLADGAVVHVLGGPNAIAPAVLDALAARYGAAVRVAGATRVATAAAIAELVVARSGTTTAMVARAGPDEAAPWADALAGGAYGAAAGIPVLLSDGDALSPETADAVEALGITDTVVLGGTAALGPAVAAALPDPVRVAGQDRAGTAAAIAGQLWGGTVRPEVVLANGYEADAWGWALAAAPLAARRGAPLLVTAAGGLPPATADWLAGSGAQGGVAVGSTRLVPPEVVYDASERLR